MNATKYTLSVELQALSKDVFEGMLVKVLEEFRNGAICGDFTYDDGDTVHWNTADEQVTF